jgi:hypothetical protein
LGLVPRYDQFISRIMHLEIAANCFRCVLPPYVFQVDSMGPVIGLTLWMIGWQYDPGVR